MATGFGSGNACYSTAQLAIDAYWQSQPVTSTPATTSSIFFHHTIIPSGTSWVLNTDRCTMTAATPTCTRGTSTLPTYTPKSCTYETSFNSFTDGALLGWGIVAAMVAAWGITVLRRGI